MSETTSKLDSQDMMPYLKKEAIVNVKLGTGFVQQLGAIIPILIEGKTQEDVSKIEQLIKDKQPLEPWMGAIATIQVLIRTVFEEADKEGMVDYRPMEDMLSEMVTETSPVTSQESLPSDQSSEVSE
jgi:hypothetical protein